MTIMSLLIYAAASPLPMCCSILAGLPIALLLPANIAVAFPL